MPKKNFHIANRPSELRRSRGVVKIVGPARIFFLCVLGTTEPNCHIPGHANVHVIWKKMYIRTQMLKWLI